MAGCYNNPAIFSLKKKRILVMIKEETREEQGMFEKLKMKSIAGKFVLTLAATFVPLGIITVTIASIIVGISSEQTYTAYQTELNSEWSIMQVHMSVIENNVDRLVSENVAKLALTSNHDEVFNYEFAQDMGENFESQLPGFVYIYDKNNVQMYTHYDYNVYDYDEMDTYRTKLLTHGVPQGTTNGWRLFQLDKKYFLIRMYGYSQYDVGLFIDLDKVLQGMNFSEELKKDDFYLTDGTKIIMINQGTFTPISRTSWDAIMDSGGTFRYLQWHGTQENFKAAIRVPSSTLFQKVGWSFALLIAVVVLEGVFLFIFWSMVRRWVVRPIQEMNTALSKMKEQTGSYYRIAPIAENESTDFRNMFENYNEMASEMEEGRRKARQLYDVQLDNLKLRVNPHMLLNSFNLIYSMAQVHNDKSIQEFSLYLVDYFRYVLKETETMVSVKKEMSFVESYLGIQKIRFPDRFNSVYNMSQDAERALIPPLLIENFVENAIKYALVPGATIEILINIRRQDSRLYISIIDTGSGIKPEVLPYINKQLTYVDKMGNEHIGIMNCRKRVKFYYHGSGKIHIASQPGEGTQVWIDVPYIEEEEAEWKY